jgi:phthiocerol/phenolphthiocerol synthesis type-I polyketide synthase C
VPLAVDVGDEPQLAEALRAVRESMPSLKGVFHAAMVLDDALVSELTPERMEKVLAPKAWGAWNLHRLTRNDPLQRFVMFSSATTAFGNSGQANYVASCLFLEQLARSRRNLGLPALAVGWGPIEDVGYVAAGLECCVARAVVLSDVA